MNATNQLFDLYKKSLGIRADLGGAKALGVKAQTVSNWRNRGSQASPKLIEVMCRRTGENSARWLLRILSEQAPDPADGAVWKRLAKQLKIPLALAGVALAAVLHSAAVGIAAASTAAWTLAGDAMDISPLVINGLV